MFLYLNVCFSLCLFVTTCFGYPLINETVDGNNHSSFVCPLRHSMLKSYNYFSYLYQPSFDKGKFNSHDQINKWLGKLHSMYPKITSVIGLERTFEGRPIMVMQIGLDSKNPSMFIEAGIHGNEWMSISTAMYIIQEVYTKLITIDRIWLIFNILNPDGYEYTRTNEKKLQVRHWKKNRRGQQNDCFGVDLNRNFDVFWKNENIPCGEDLYHGPNPYSENETKHLHQFFKENKHNFVSYISLRSYGMLWLYSYGNALNSYPSDVEDLKKVAKQAAKEMEKFNGNVFKIGSIADILEPSDGTSMDWAKDKLKIKWSYTIFTAPHKENKPHFEVKPHKIIETGEEIFAGIKTVAAAILNEEK